MRARNPVPTAWAMTDERMGGAMWRVLRRMPPGSGVVFRHYATPARERRAMLLRVRRIAVARRLVVVVAGEKLPGRLPRHGRGPGAWTWPAHDRRQAFAGKRAGARVFFVSPVFKTRSHPGVEGLGAMKAARVARGLGAVVALGGMDAQAWRRVRRLGFVGWAGIDGFMTPRGQKPARAHDVPEP